MVRRTRRRQNCTNANHRCACSLLDVCADPAAPRHPPPGHGSAGCVHHVIELVISQRHSPPESPPCRTASWARSRGRSWRRRYPPPCLGTLGRGRMPRAVCQGSCSLLRDPASGKQTVKRTTPTPGGVLGGHGASLRLPDASVTAQDAHPDCQDGPRCLHDGSRWPPDGQRGLQDAPRGLQEPCHEVPRKQKSLIFLSVFERFWHSRRFGFPTLQNGPRGPQDRPKIAQEASKMAP